MQGCGLSLQRSRKIRGTPICGCAFSAAPSGKYQVQANGSHAPTLLRQRVQLLLQRSKMHGPGLIGSS
eukprot:8982630-Lingulodinium_polyedra.AAC.1